MNVSKTLKQISFIVLTALVMFGCFGAGVVSADPVADNDSSNQVMIINSIDDLKIFADAVKGGKTYEGSTVTLNTDLDLAELGTNWSGIEGEFKGTFNGNGKTIKNVSINSGDYSGFFEKVYGNGCIKDLTIEEAHIIGKDRAGVFAGEIGDNVKIENCKSINCTVSNKGGGGGIIGKVWKPENVVITNCEASNIKITNSADYSGGIVGFIENGDSITITNCHASGKIEGNDWVGGLIGMFKKNAVSNVSGCTSSCVVIGNQYIGGLIAELHETEINVSGCSVNGSMNGGIDTVTGTNKVGGFVGRLYKMKENSEIKDCAVTNVLLSGLGDHDVGGFLGSSDKGEVCKISNCTVNNGKVIGLEQKTNYVGGFVGWAKNLAIENCSTTVSEVCGHADVGGFAGKLNEYAIDISNCVVGKDIPESILLISGVEAVGGFVGRVTNASENSIIEDSNAYNVKVVCTNKDAGGFVGNIDDGRCKINNCHTNGEVIAPSATSVGGFSGFTNKTYITNSTANCTVSGDSVVGGFSGKAEGDDLTIKDCKVNGSDIRGREEVGGFVGFVNNPKGKQNVIDNCRVENVSILATSSNIGGFAGTLTDKETPLTLGNIVINSVKIDAPKSDHVGGFCGNYYDGGNKEEGSTVKLGQITTNNITISAQSQVGGLFGYIDSDYLYSIKDYKLGGITINASGDDVGGFIGFLQSDVDKLTIDNCTVAGQMISGNDYVGGFIGNHMSSARLKIEIKNSTSSCDIKGNNYVGGFIPCVRGYFETPTEGEHIVTYDGYKITDCNTTGNISGSTNVGGIVGYAEMYDIENCKVTSNISGTKENVGGIIGYAVGCIIKDCIVEGDVGVETANNVGGLVGTQKNVENLEASTLVPTKITKSYTIGDVTGNSAVGGIAGSSITTKDATESNKIDNTYSSGNITSVGGKCGGIVGEYINGAIYPTIEPGKEYAGDIAHSYSTGKIVTTNASDAINGTGSIVGYAHVTQPDSGILVRHAGALNSSLSSNRTVGVIFGYADNVSQSNPVINYQDCFGWKDSIHQLISELDKSSPLEVEELEDSQVWNTFGKPDNIWYNFGYTTEIWMLNTTQEFKLPTIIELGRSKASAIHLSDEPVTIETKKIAKSIANKEGKTVNYVEFRNPVVDSIEFNDVTNAKIICVSYKDPKSKSVFKPKSSNYEVLSAFDIISLKKLPEGYVTFKAASQNPNAVQLMHFANGKWEKVSTEYQGDGLYCAGPTTFSPFAVVEYKGSEPVPVQPVKVVSTKSSSSVASFYGVKEGNNFTFNNAVVITSALLPGATNATVVNNGSSTGWYNCNLSTDGFNGNGIVYFQVPTDVIDIKGYTVNDISLNGSSTTYLGTEGKYAKYSAPITKDGAISIGFVKDAAKTAALSTPVTTTVTNPVTETKKVVETTTPVTTAKVDTPVTTQKTAETTKTTTATQTSAKSPFPILGILAGLGIAGALVMRRKL